MICSFCAAQYQMIHELVLICGPVVGDCCSIPLATRCKSLVTRPLIPLWDLAVVLDTFSSPIWAYGGDRDEGCFIKDGIALGYNHSKVCNWLFPATLSACSLPQGTIKSVCSSTQPLCLKWWSQPTDLPLWSPPFSSGEEQKFKTLCPLQAL